MKESVEYMILSTIQKHASVMPLFKSGYSYAKVMQWSRELEKENKITYNDAGEKVLTTVGVMRLRKIKANRQDFLLLPLIEYRVPKMNIDDIYLP